MFLNKLQTEGHPGEHSALKTVLNCLAQRCPVQRILTWLDFLVIERWACLKAILKKPSALKLNNSFGPVIMEDI